MNKNKPRYTSSKYTLPEGLLFFYNLNIAPLVIEYKQCIKLKRKTDRTNISLFIVSVICAIGVFQDVWNGLEAFFVIIFLIAYSFDISHYKESILSEFKTKIILIILSYFEPNFTYLETDNIGNGNLRSFEIFPEFDSENNSGSVFGRYKNRDIQMSLISLQKEIGEESEEVFKGLIIIVNFDDELFKSVIASFSHQQHSNNLPRIHPTHFIFNSSLCVYSDDEFEARRLITPSFVDHLYRLEVRTGLDLTFSFKAGLLLISIPTELPNLSFHWQDLRYDFNNIIECMQLMFDVLDILQLDDDT